MLQEYKEHELRMSNIQEAADSYVLKSKAEEVSVLYNSGSFVPNVTVKTQTQSTKQLVKQPLGSKNNKIPPIMAMDIRSYKVEI